MLGTSESERLRVTALNLFHPTASPLSKEVVFHVATQPLEGKGRKWDILVILNLFQDLPTFLFLRFHWIVIGIPLKQRHNLELGQSTRPLSVSFDSGMTGKARKESAIKGSRTSQPRSLTAR